MNRSGRLAKVLLYSHDSYGMGHLRRNLVIAGGLLSDSRPAQVVLASGSPVLHRVKRPQGLVCAQLPPIVKTGPDDYRPFGTDLPMSLVTRARSAVLCDIVRRWQPDVLLVDHAPQGAKGELLPVFDLIRTHSPHTAVMLGLRDILDEPARVRSAWSQQHVYETLESVYDQVVVYGERDVFDVVGAYAIPQPLASAIQFCGYVTGPGLHQIDPKGGAADRGLVFGTIGGGGDGVEVLIATARGAVAAGRPALLCTGPLMSDIDRRTLDAALAGLPGVQVVEQTDVAAAARTAGCVVTRGGYNTLCELVPLGVPVVVVPRVWPRREQLLRAQAFAGRGLVHLVDPAREDLDGGVQRAVQDATSGRIGQGPRRPLDISGAHRVVDALHRVARSHTAMADRPELRQVVPA